MFSPTSSTSDSDASPALLPTVSSPATSASADDHDQQTVHHSKGVPADIHYGDDDGDAHTAAYSSPPAPVSALLSPASADDTPEALLPTLNTLQRLAQGQRTHSGTREQHDISWRLSAPDFLHLRHLLDLLPPHHPHYHTLAWAADKARLEYRPEPQQLHLRMPTSTHEFLANRVVELLLTTLTAHLEQHPHPSYHALHRNVFRAEGCPTISLGDNSDQCPDQCIGIPTQGKPTVIVEVGFSNDPDQDRAWRYLEQGDGEILTVLCLYVEYREPRARREDRSAYDLKVSLYRLEEEGAEAGDGDGRTSLPTPKTNEHDIPTNITNDNASNDDPHAQRPPTPPTPTLRPVCVYNNITIPPTASSPPASSPACSTSSASPSASSSSSASPTDLTLRLGDFHHDLPWNESFSIPMQSFRQALDEAIHKQLLTDGAVPGARPRGRVAKRRREEDEEAGRGGSGCGNGNGNGGESLFTSFESTTSGGSRDSGGSEYVERTKRGRTVKRIKVTEADEEVGMEGDGVGSSMQVGRAASIGEVPVRYHRHQDGDVEAALGQVERRKSQRISARGMG